MTQKLDTSPARLLQLATDAIDFYGDEDMAAAFQAIAAEKEAQAGQEPHDWRCSKCAHLSAYEGATEGDNWCSSCGAMHSMLPLYLAPQPSEPKGVDFRDPCTKGWLAALADVIHQTQCEHTKGKLKEVLAHLATQPSEPAHVELEQMQKALVQIANMPNDGGLNMRQLAGDVLGLPPVGQRDCHGCINGNESHSTSCPKHPTTPDPQRYVFDGETWIRAAQKGTT